MKYERIPYTVEAIQWDGKEQTKTLIENTFNIGTHYYDDEKRILAWLDESTEQRYCLPNDYLTLSYNCLYSIPERIFLKEYRLYIKDSNETSL